MRATRIAAPLGAMLVAGPLAAVGAAVAAIAAPSTPPQHLFTQVAMSPDGAHVASLEADLPADENAEPTFRIVIRSVSGEGQPVTVGLPCKGAECVPSSLAWSMDSHRLAFVLQQPDPHKTDHRRRVYAVDASGAGLSQLLAFDGTLEGLRYGPGGSLAVLATAGAHKEPGATQAAAKMTGEIGESEDEQRIGTIADGALHYQSPADLYVYEYDWQPDQAQPDHVRFVGTAAHGNGDNNWWVAKLYGFDGGAARVLYSPPQRQQLADPVVSPDGTSVAFIGGIMSDFGSTGGDVFRLALDQVGTGGTTAPVAASVLQNLTPNLRASVTALSWACGGGGLTATALAGSKAELMTLGGGAEHVIWSGEETLSASRGGDGIACGGGNSAAIHQNFTTAPEIEAGPIGQWHPLTHANASQHVAVSVRSVEWHNDGSDVQGWLLSPGAGMPAGAVPPGAMIVSVHGGPSAASTPIFLSQRGLTLFLLQAGYRVFLPNPRGSFGQGETFTQANVRDFGHGDLRDILTGIDAVERIAPVDDHRLGLTGYSYGGYMTMWTVTQTNRFAAAVAGAGVSDWQSYYGENGIDEWMLPFFGASVYDDPTIYAKSSPMTYIRQVHTPTFEFVGDADVECPMPQTQEFYHALHTLGVPTEFVVYAGQGHGMRDPADLADARRRMLAWFAKYLTPKTSKG